MEKIFLDHNHGIGVAWFNNRGLAEYKKGMTTPKEAFDFIQTIDGSICLHFRKKSIGEENGLLTHPFEVSKLSPLRLQGQCRKLIFHNGTFPLYDELLMVAGITEPKDELMSDSRAFAMILSSILERTGSMDLFIKLITSLDKRTAYQKFAIADCSRKQFHIFGGFTELDGVHYSTTLWNYTRTTYNPNKNHRVEFWEKENDDYIGETTKPQTTVVHGTSFTSHNDKKRLKRRAEQVLFWKQYLGVKDTPNVENDVSVVGEVTIDNNADTEIVQTQNGETIIQEKEGTGPNDKTIKIHSAPPSPFLKASSEVQKILGIHENRTNFHDDCCGV